MFIDNGFNIYGPTWSFFSHPKHLIGLVFVSQSSSGINYEGFRHHEVELAPLMVNRFQPRGPTRLKSLFPNETGPFIAPHIHFLSQLLINRMCVSMNFTFQELSINMRNSKIRRTNLKLWSFCIVG